MKIIKKLNIQQKKELDFIISEYTKYHPKKNVHMNNFYLEEYQKCLEHVKNKEMTIFKSLPTTIDFRINQLFLFDASVTTNLQKIVKALSLSYITKNSKMVRYTLTDFVYMKARLKLKNLSITVRIVKKTVSSDKLSFILVHLYKEFNENKDHEKRSPFEKQKLISKTKEGNRTQHLNNVMYQLKKQKQFLDHSKMNIEKSQNPVLNENSQLVKYPQMDEKIEQQQRQELYDNVDYEKEEQEYLLLSRLLKNQLIEELKQRKERLDRERILTEQELKLAQQKRTVIQGNQVQHKELAMSSHEQKGDIRKEQQQMFLSNPSSFKDRSLMSKELHVKSKHIVKDTNDDSFSCS